MLHVPAPIASNGGATTPLRAGSHLRIRLTHIDGKLPNLALMKLAAYHRKRGDEIYFTRNVRRDLFEGHYDRVYGSTIFSRSAPLVTRFRQEFPDAIVGGTGLINEQTYSWQTIENYLGVNDFEHYDYEIYKDWTIGTGQKKRPYTASLGFLTRGCRMRCGFCVVPRKEGKPQTVNSLENIWRGEPYPRHLHLLDNDFFGVDRTVWETLIDGMIAGHYRVCLNQGINLRLIDKIRAEAIARIPYYDDSFEHRRLYTAWDNLRDEAIFRRGVDLLAQAGIPPNRLMVYMLVGYDTHETWDRLFERFETMIELGVKPYPMVYEKSPNVSGNDLPYKRLKDFQRWVNRKYYTFIAWDDYDVNNRNRRANYDHSLRLVNNA